MKKKILNNWLLKLASLLFAFIVWLIVINIGDPVDDKTFTNVRVNLLNTNVITDKNMVYEVLDGTDVVRTVRVSAVKSVIDKLTEGDIVAEADCANLTLNKTIEIKFYSNRDNSSIQDISGSIEMVKLNIEEKMTKGLTLLAETVGETADGYIVNTLQTDQNRIEVSGPKSVISRISTAKVTVDISEASSDIFTNADVILYDSEGNEVTSSLLTMNTESVKVTVRILATKEVPLIFDVMGTPAPGYMYTGEIESNPQTVMIAGSSTVLAGINSIAIPEEALNITGQDTNMMTIVNVKEYLPDYVILTGSFNGKAKVTVYIEQVATRELKIAADHIRILGLKEGFIAELDNTVTEYTVTVKGLAADLTALNAETVYGHIMIEDMLEERNMEELQAGTYTVPVEFTLGEDITIVQELQVSMKIIETEE